MNDTTNEEIVMASYMVRPGFRGITQSECRSRFEEWAVSNGYPKYKVEKINCFPELYKSIRTENAYEAWMAAVEMIASGGM